MIIKTMIWIFILLGLVLFVFNPLFIIFALGFLIVYNRVFRLEDVKAFSERVANSIINGDKTDEKCDKCVKTRTNINDDNSHFMNFLDDQDIPKRTHPIDCTMYNE